MAAAPPAAAGVPAEVADLLRAIQGRAARGAAYGAEMHGSAQLCLEDIEALARRALERLPGDIHGRPA